MWLEELERMSDKEKITWKNYPHRWITKEMIQWLREEIRQSIEERKKWKVYSGVAFQPPPDFGDLGGGFRLSVEFEPKIHAVLTKDSEVVWQSKYYLDLAEANAVVLGTEIKEANILPSDLDFENKILIPITEEAKKKYLERAYEKPLEFIDQVLAKTIKFDRIPRRLIMLGMISTYGPSPLNIIVKHETSTGKSWMLTECAKFTPGEDLIMYADASPTSFFWKHASILCKEHGEKCPEKCRSEKYRMLSLHHKILCFLDQPHDLLLNYMKPLLSHDQKALIRLTTDPQRKSATKAVEVKIVGWPSVFYASCQQATDPEIASRSVIIGPSDSAEKIQEVLDFMTEKERDPHQWRQEYESDLAVETAKEIIRSVKEFSEKYMTIDVEKPYIAELETRFVRRFPRSARAMRTFPQLLALIDTVTILNHKNRLRKERDKSVILTSKIEDADIAFEILEYFAEGLKYGLSSATIDIYNTVIKPLIEEKGPISKKDIVLAYAKTKARHLGERWIHQYYLKPLMDAGLLTETTDPYDKRRTLYNLVKDEDNVTGDSPLHPKNTP